MRASRRKLASQVFVITGATSGIGLTTARAAARAGAHMVLIARNGEALTELADELTAKGVQAAWYVADVGDEAQVSAAADAAISRFGRIDTWVNNAGVSIYGHAADVSVEDRQRLFQTNFWGVVNGSLVAMRHMKQRGGTLINLGSELSDVAVPLQSFYTASKHAVKGFTNALRMEVSNARVPVSVTLIKPAAVDSMFAQHAKNYMNRRPKLPPPVYAPDVVAKAILHAAQYPARELYIGGAAVATVLSGTHAPALYNFVMSRLGFPAQQKSAPADDAGTDHALHRAGEGMSERSGRNGPVLESSAYTLAAMHPVASAAISVGLILGCTLGWRRLRGV